MLINETDYPKKISQIFVESRSKMKELTSYESNGLSNWKYDAIYYVYGDSLKIYGPHEFSHVIVNNLWGENHSYYWLGEGFAVVSDDSWGRYNLHLLCKYLFDQKKLLTIQELRKNFAGHSSLITYPEAGSFVKYLYEKYGCQKLKQLWQQDDGMVKSIYGKSFEELESEWLEVVKSHDAHDVKYRL